jgi:hypothetical protein
MQFLIQEILAPVSYSTQTEMAFFIWLKNKNECGRFEDFD